MASIIAFRHTQPAQNWTNEELAELYRVVDILGRAGVSIDTDMGLSDEGEPWFTFCRADSGDVIAHFSRIDGQFVAVSATMDAVVRGNNFRRVAEALVNRQPLILPAPVSGQKLFLHPAVILTALVATTLAQMKSLEGRQVSAIEDLADAAINTSAISRPAEGTFSETLKTAFLDAINLVLRGFSGAADVKNAAADHAQATLPGLGLGNLSLASVVAFAISVIQGELPQEETDLAAREASPSEAAESAAIKAATLAAAVPAAENKSSAEASELMRTTENRDLGPVKAAPKDLAVIGNMEKAGPADKSASAATTDESIARTAQKELADRLMTADAGTGAEQIKLAADNVNGETPAVKVEPVREQAVVAEQKEPPATHLAELKNTTELHRFNFTEISSEAVEIFFFRGRGNTGDRGGPEPAPSGSPLARDDSNGVSGADQARPALNASDIVFAGGDPVVMARLNLITDFVNSPDNRMSSPAAFPDALKSYWAGDTALTVVIYDSADLPLNIFSFTRDVIFVEESQFTAQPPDFADGSLQLKLANGGDVTLLGVFNLDPLVTA